jgi:dienelactone hydrolase
VVCHGQGASKDWGFFPPTAERLARAGFTAVVFTFTGGDGLADLGMVLDALASGEWGGGVVPDGYGLLGHSRGGSVAVSRAAQDRRVRALVTWGAPPPPPPAAVRAPWLIVHGERDETVPVQAARDLHRASVAAGSKLLLVKGGSHTFSVGDPWRGPTRAFDIALDASIDWLARHLA